MSFLEHPIVQKAASGLIVAGAVAVSGLTWNAHVKLSEHELQLKQVTEMRADIKNIQQSTQAIQIDIAVLKERVKDDSSGKAVAVR